MSDEADAPPAEETPAEAPPAEEAAPAEAAPPPEPIVDPKLLDAAIRFLSGAPPGEFDDVFAALTQFVADKNVPVVAKKRALPGWIKSSCIPVEVEGKKALICQDAELPDGKFVDPNTQKPFTFDFESRKVTSVAPDALPSTSLRETLQSAVQKWAEGALRNGNAGVYDSTGGVTVVVSGSTISKENFRTGSLVLRFNLNAGVVSGSIKLRAHCYELGNAVGEQETTFKETIPGGNDEEVATNLCKTIGTIYSNWTTKLQEGFELLANEGLDRLRRKLPVTKTQVNWRQEIIGAASMPAGKK
jgi:hypothetical protein